MSKTLLAFSAAVVMLGAASASAQVVERLRPGIAVEKSLVNPQIRDQLRTTRPDLRLACADLAAVLTQAERPDGTITITYGVKNVGRIDYISGANQQTVNLSRDGGRPVVRTFQNLRAGEERTWTETFRPFEFPSRYQASLAFDPDLYIDASTANDECNRANNSLALTTAR